MSPWVILGWLILFIVGGWVALNILALMAMVLSASKTMRVLVLIAVCAGIVRLLTRG
jgi:hypothetical protein